MKEDLIERLEYIILCAGRAIQQEKKEMEILGRWYINQQLDDIERSAKTARVIHNGRQHKIEFSEK